MSKLSSFVPVRAIRAGLLTLAAALVIVPTLARARQHIEHRDTTRLSIRHSWLGVAPPTKASSTPVMIAVITPPIVLVDRDTVVSRISVVTRVHPRIVDDSRLEPLRGPPVSCIP